MIDEKCKSCEEWTRRWAAAMKDNDALRLVLAASEERARQLEAQLKRTQDHLDEFQGHVATAEIENIRLGRERDALKKSVQRGPLYVSADELDDGMCPDCVAPWKCNGCETHHSHNCEKCHAGPATTRGAKG